MTLLLEEGAMSAAGAAAMRTESQSPRAVERRGMILNGVLITAEASKSWTQSWEGLGFPVAERNPEPIQSR